MTSFKIELWIFNQPLPLAITHLDANFPRFKVETIIGGNGATILAYLPDHTWAAERVAMKYLTRAYIDQLGKLIELKKPELFLSVEF